MLPRKYLDAPDWETKESARRPPVSDSATARVKFGKFGTFDNVGRMGIVGVGGGE